MSTLSIDLAAPDPSQGPACTKCAGRTRLVGIEPHPSKVHTDLRTYQCLACDATRVVAVSIAN